MDRRASAAVAVRRLGVVDRAVDLEFETPKAEVNISAGGQGREVKLTPAVETEATEVAEDGAGFVFAVGPEFGELRSELGVGG